MSKKVVCHECIDEQKSGNGEKGCRMPGTRGKGRAQLYRGYVFSVGSLKPGSGAFQVVLPPGDGAAAMSRTAGSSSMRLFRS